MMPNVTIQINKPVIVSPAYFKVRYRLLPGGSFTAYQNETNSPFTLTGLTEGQYELEALYVNTSGLECQTTDYFFEVVEPEPCIEFTVEILFNTQSRPYMHVTYTLPMGYVDPPCGHLLTWLNNVTGSTGTVNIATLPTANFIDIYFPNNFSVTDTFTITIQANMCNGIFTDCFTGTITPDVPPCTGIAITNIEMAMVSFSPPLFTITLTITNSTPATINTNIAYQQVNNLLSGVLDNGMVNTNLTIAAGGSGSISFNVQPNVNIQDSGLVYNGSVSDICGDTTAWSITFPF